MRVRASALSALATGTFTLVAASCGSESPVSSERGLRLAVAPLSLPGIDDACYDFRVRNAANQTVTSRGNPTVTRAGEDQTTAPATRATTGPIPADTTTICASQFGNGQGGDITYITPCDADGPDTDNDGLGEQQNTVTLWVDGIYGTGGVDLRQWQDPCGTAGCALTFTCEENRDAQVEFNLTIMREANQGFFDVAVNFDDIFCSAKLDTCYGTSPANQQPMTLLTGGDQVRDPTAVFAFACTAGTAQNVTTTLLYGPVELVCTQGTFPINPLAGPGNASVTVSGITLHYAIYRGTEALQCSGASCNKAYWNLAIDLVGSNASGNVALTNCGLSLQTTAHDGTGFANGFPTAQNSAYPYIDVDSALTAVNGAPICQKNPLNGTDALRSAPSNVTTVYQGAAGGLSGVLTAPAMCAAYNGTTAASTLACGNPELQFQVNDAPVTTYAFGSHAQGANPQPTASFTAKNVGEGPSTALATTFVGNGSVFSVSQNTCTGSVLAAGQSCAITLTLLTATAPPGTFTASLTVASDAVTATLNPISATLDPPLGTLMTTTPTHTTVEFGTVTPPGSPRAIAADLAGNAWACNAGIFLATTGVYKVAPNGVLTAYPTTSECVGVASDDNGNVWVAERGGVPPVLNRFAPNGARLQIPIVTPAEDIGTLGVGVRVAADGEVWVPIRQGTGGRSRVSRFNNAGTLLATYSTCNFPIDVSFDGVGHAWVSCLDGGAISRIALATGGVTDFGNSGGLGTGVWSGGFGFFLPGYDGASGIEKLNPADGSVTRAPGGGLIFTTPNGNIWTLGGGGLIEYDTNLVQQRVVPVTDGIGGAVYDATNDLIWLTHPGTDSASYISFPGGVATVNPILNIGNEPWGIALRGTSNVWIALQNGSGGQGFIAQIAR